MIFPVVLVHLVSSQNHQFFIIYPSITFPKCPKMVRFEICANLKNFFLLLGIFANRILASDIIFLCFGKFKFTLPNRPFLTSLRYCVSKTLQHSLIMAVFATSEYPSIFKRVCGLSRRFLNRTNLRWLNVRYLTRICNDSSPLKFTFKIGHFWPSSFVIPRQDTQG